LKEIYTAKVWWVNLESGGMAAGEKLVVTRSGARL